MEIEELRRRMNACGAAGRPFLFAVDFELTQGLFVEEPLAQSEILFRVPGYSNMGPCRKEVSSIGFIPSPEPYARYRARFDLIREGLLRGDTFLTNLTVRTPLVSCPPLDEILYHSNAPFALRLPGRFVCFSPERFVCVDGRRIATYPMKGTIDGRVPHAAEKILADPKESAEHDTIVDLMRNDLGMVAESIRVERFRYIDTLATSRGPILQVSSEISGFLPEHWAAHMGEWLFRMLPAGSISGAPKRSTIDLIRRAEVLPRGFYTGVFGVFDGRRLDSAVMIRFIEETAQGCYFRSGGGVTARSDARSEYEEIIEKIYLPYAPVP